MTQPTNYAYLAGALQGSMKWLPMDLVSAGLLKQKDLEKAEKLVAAILQKCEDRERAFTESAEK